MIKSSASVDVDRPAGEVFRYVADLRNEPKWHSDIASVPSDTDPVPVVGKTYPVTFKPFLGKTDGSFTAVEVEPDERIVYRATLGGLSPTITYTVASTGSGARFTRSVEMSPSGVLVVLTPMMALMVPRRNQTFVENLKQAIESTG
jgi:uncharacterized protein YndB with AHSA1/START domain